MSLQSQRIRQKFRQEIRTRQISQLMKIHRAKAIRECLEFHTFMSLNNKIIENINQKDCMKIVEQLTTLLDTHPQNQNTYILISNYFVDHADDADAYKYLELKILNYSEKARSLDNYKRVLLIMMVKNKEIKEAQLKEYDLAMAQVFHYSNSQRQLNDCFKILQIILSLSIFTKQNKLIPQKCVQQFFLKLSQFEITSLQADTKYYIIQTICHLGIDHLDNPFIHLNYIPDIIRVMILGISEYPKFRDHLIFVLKTIVIDHFEQFENILKGQLAEDLFRQLTYIYEYLPRERKTILNILKLMIKQLSSGMIYTFLNLKLHLLIVSCIKELSADEMIDCISIVILLFNKLVSTQQPEILQKVQDSLEEYQNFQTNIHQVYTQKSDPEVQKLIQQLIDNFYTSEMR